MNINSAVQCTVHHSHSILGSSKPTIQKQPIKGITMISMQSPYDPNRFKALIDKFRALDFTDEE
ncbi:hypothetical protein SB761_36980, partial [Pseudomonas sp. SIMBA_064]